MSRREYIKIARPKGLTIFMAPTTGLEPVTSKLTASCSTIELRRNTDDIIYFTLWISQLSQKPIEELPLLALFGALYA